jgi:glycosyltransferase involved in cell wall biosynthesis
MVTNMWPHDANPVYGIFVRRQIEALQALGLECDVLFIEGHRTRWEYARAALHMLRLNWSTSRPLLVHSHGGETSLAVCWFVRGRVVMSYCGDDVLGTPRTDGSLIPSSRVRRLVFRQMARLMSGTVTKSAEMAATLPRKARARNVVVPNGVDRSLFGPRSRDEARRRLGWLPTDRIVLFAADPAVPRKRYWLAQAACVEAERRIGPVQLRVANGTSPDAMPIRMAAADCLLLTSSIEGSPNVVKEAVTCGLPVVSTDVGDVRRVLRGVEPSWLSAPRPDQLAAALVECLAARRRSDGWVRSRWLDQREIGVQLVEFYRRLAPDLRFELRDNRRLGSHRDSARGDCSSSVSVGDQADPRRSPASA